MTNEDIIELADQVTTDLEGRNYSQHNEEAWALEFAERLRTRWINEEEA